MNDAIAAEVLAVDALSPSIVRMRLAAPDFVSLDVPDEACVVTFPAPGERTADPDPSGGHWYTVRRVEPAGLTMDVVVHEVGAASEWARRGRPGDRLQLSAQGSWYRRPDDVGWQLLVVDTTGLPAAGRIVEDCPAGIRTLVVAEVPDPADGQDLRGAEVTWVHNPGVAHGDSQLERAARAVALPDGPGYVYVAGEAAATRRVRRYLRHELSLPATSYGVIGYWRRDAKAFAERVAQASIDPQAVWEEAEAVATDPEHAMDLWEERMGRAGLL